MAMTKQERATRTAIARYLRMQGYVTYASILIKVDLNFHNPPNEPFAASMNPKTGTIYLNPTITDRKAVSTIIRHEILHNFLEHHMRLMKHLADKSGLDYDKLDDLSINELERKLFSNDKYNVAADYEISNRGYTDSDKEVQRKLGYLGDIYEKAAKNNPMITIDSIRGLVTEDDHPEWVYDSVEEMYDKLTDELEKEKQRAEQQAEDEEEDVITGFLMPGESIFMDRDNATIYIDDLKDAEQAMEIAKGLLGM